MKLLKKKADRRIEIVLEQWKTCVAMADSIAQKRNVSNGVYITINTAILTLVTSEYGNVLLSLIGIIICLLWVFSIKNYVKLSKVKYELINEMEMELPFQPYKAEWERLNSIEKYRPLTWFEKCMPFVFIVLFLLYSLYPILKWLVRIFPCLVNNLI